MLSSIIISSLRKSRLVARSTVGPARSMGTLSVRAIALLLALRTTAALDVPEWGRWQPETEGWRALMDKREAQIARLDSSQERFDGYINLATSGILTPNFTRLGFSVVPQPPGVHARLNTTLHAGLNRAGGPRSEHFVDQISGPDADFVDLGKLASEILHELLPQHEAWIGGEIPLKPSIAYGLRVYRQDNQLTMHTDRVSSHVVSSILHVDRDTDEPWPIVIEGFDGLTYEVLFFSFL